MTSTALVHRRSIPNRFEASSFSVAASESATTLAYVLANITPEELHKQLSSASTTLMPWQIENLLAALQSAGIVTSVAQSVVADKTKRHCARCHKTYLEKQNGSDACVVLHCRPEMKEQGGPGRKVEYQYACCGLKAVLAISGRAHPCFKGRHTTLAENVKYRLNVWTCERTKCVLPAPALESQAQRY